MPTEIPLRPLPSSKFNIQLANRILTITTKYNSRGAESPFWTINIAEGDNSIIEGIPLLLGAEILAPFNLGIGAMFLFDFTGTGTDATDTSLGTTVRLIYYTPEEKEAQVNA